MIYADMRQTIKKGLDFLEESRYNINVDRWRDVRAGRRSTIGNRVYGYNRIWGSNPHFSAKRETAIFERELSFLFVFTKPIKNFVQIKNAVYT